MARYLQIAGEIGQRVNAFAKRNGLTNTEVADLAYMLNLAVRACPQAVQSTVRKNIVGIAVKGYCDVGMVKETDRKTGRQYNKITITPIGGGKPVVEMGGDDGTLE